jgi:ABC-type uncharacterized transport system auxiliary subunit
MVLSRRTALHLAGTTVATALAGCASQTPGSSTNPTQEYSLSLDRIEQPLASGT